MIQRSLNPESHLKKGKVLILYGARQVGKTTLVKTLLTQPDRRYAFYTGDDLPFATAFGKCDLQIIKNMVQGLDLLLIDEAQKIERIGTALKLVADHFPDLYVVVTGSSSFDLANSTEEPLTGRKNVLTLFPLSMQEIAAELTPWEAARRLHELLIYGSYPEVFSLDSFREKENRITEIKNAYLIKDILEFQLLKRSHVILDLLKLLAFQIGSEVSTVELGKQLGLDYKTVQRYLDLLEKSFVLVSLQGFSRNLRKEVSKMKMYYFMDLGIRNAVIANFNPIELRNDAGQLWENFMIIERIKRNAYSGKTANYYFWRTYDQKEIDLIEESGGSLRGFEFKWSSNRRVKAPKEWLQTYDNATWECITPENYTAFVQ
ncbi:MAG: ATP-binding protein [Candidatus Cyclonatronum sp.]|uniref:ATP-binding protein n=1 Tax=Cyclonatronum sp. TaxID=3024185 RepID=UPI0025BB5012|nr:ATP-binding protein [Cyclonatronum sp.]MCC5935429.1 ATP-binding protein [Balneolales bacterium]MCH8487864.1 ATP-binding protein [Cyclonatronum sp.]